MSAIRGMILVLLAIVLTGCNTLFGNLWPTIPKGFDAVSQTSGHESACASFGALYGTDEPLPHFVSTLVTGKRYQMEATPEAGDEALSPYLTQDDVRDHFDSFLDCYFVDLSHLKKPEGEIYTDEEIRVRKELFALRGHAIVTVLARYAAYNLTGRIAGGLHTTPFPPYDDLASDASSILTRIEYAERLIRRESEFAPKFQEDVEPEVQKSADSLVAFHSVRRTNRVFSVIQLAYEAERPTLRRSYNFLSKFWSFVSGRSLTAFKNVIAQAFTGLEKAVLTGIYQRAYQSDADNFLGSFETSAPSDDDWKKIDKALRNACDQLSVIAGGAVPHCLPPEPPAGNSTEETPTEGEATEAEPST